LLVDVAKVAELTQLDQLAQVAQREGDVAAATTTTAAAAPEAAECDACADDPATMHCGDCKKNHFFCDSCHASVHSKAKNQSHVSVDITTYLSSIATTATTTTATAAATATATVAAPTCAVHSGQPIIVHCFTCQENICALCGSFDHGPHEKELISEVHEAAKKEVEDTVKKGGAVSEKLCAAKVQFNNLKDQIRSSADASKVVVKAVARQIRQALVVASDAANAQVDRTTERKLALLEGQADEVNAAVENIAGGAHLATTTVAAATPAELVERKALLVEGLRQLFDHGVRLTPKCGATVRAAATAKLDVILEAILEAIVVEDVDVNPEACTAKGDGTVAAEVGSPAQIEVATFDFDGKALSQSSGDVVEMLLVKCGAGGSSGGRSGGGGNGSGDGAAGAAGAAGDGSNGGGSHTTVVRGAVVDRKNGKYTCTFTPTTEEGDWQVVVKVVGAHIKGSPMPIEVTAPHKPSWVEGVFKTKVQPETAGNCSFGVFFEVEAGPRDVTLTGIMGGSYSEGAAAATLYVCQAPLDAAATTDRTKWEAVGTCELIAKSVSTGMLTTEVHIPAGEKRGFLLHTSAGYITLTPHSAATEGNGDVTLIPNCYCNTGVPFAAVGGGSYLPAGGILYQVHM
jgi:hypothetical protein